MNVKSLYIALMLFIAQGFIRGQSTGSFEIKPQYRNRVLPYGLEEKIPSRFPKVALSLSGGGARGLAQIGVLRAIAENDIPVELVIGTSMGSIVGGLYSIGYSITELDSIAKHTDWDELLSVNPKSNRRDFFVEQKMNEDRSVFSLRLKGLKPLLPTSINDGQRLTNYLSLLTLQAPIRISDNFAQFEKSFGAVCTDLIKGTAVLLKQGTLAQALRASSSVSFFLSPIKFDSLTLVDGGLTANIPVIITKQEGADIIIAVNTTSELHNETELGAPWNVADQVVSIPMKLLNESQLKAADFVITPALGSLTSTNFSVVDSLVSLGYQTALPATANIRAAIEKKFDYNLETDCFWIRKPLLVSAPEALRDPINRLFTKDSVSNAQILKLIYLLNKDNFYEDISCVVTPLKNFSTVSIIAKPSMKMMSVSYSGIEHLSGDSLTAIINRFSGKPFGGMSTYNLIKSILSQYRNLGYSLASLDTMMYDSTLQHLHIVFNEGRIARINIEGNQYTKASIISREIPIKEGDIFINNNLRQGLNNLRSTNLFDNVAVSVQKNGDDNTLTFHVNEKISSIVRFGFKLDNENIPQVSIDARDENILGSGTEFGMMTFLSSRANSFIIEQKANRIFDTYFTYNIRAFYTTNNIYTYSETQSTRTSYRREQYGLYQQSAYGLSFGIGTQVERFGNVIFKGTYEIDKLRNIEKSPVTEGRVRIVAIRASSTIDTQDKYPYPNRGIKFNAFYEIASVKLGSEIGYTNIGGEYLINVPLSETNTLSTGLKIGTADKTLPLAQQYSLGGQFSFMGMRENEYRGRQIFVGALEYRYQLPFRIFFETYVQAKYNIGSIWEVQDQLRISDFNHGLGATLSFNTPIGPADFAMGRTFSIVKDASPSLLRLGPVYFYFSIGFYY